MNQGGVYRNSVSSRARFLEAFAKDGACDCAKSWVANNVTACPHGTVVNDDRTTCLHVSHCSYADELNCTTAQLKKIKEYYNDRGQC